MSDDPNLPLFCPRCGSALRWIARMLTEDGGVVDPLAHSYACPNQACNKTWKLGARGPLEEGEPAGDEST